MSRSSGRYAHEKIPDPTDNATDPVYSDGGRPRSGRDCSSCGASLPPNARRCSYCNAPIQEQSEPGHRRSYTGDGSDADTSTDADLGPTWSFDRVIFATVPAPTSTVALAKAKGIFRRRDGRTVTIREQELKSVTLVAEFDKAPVDSLTSDWDTVPGVAPVSSSDADMVFEELPVEDWERTTVDGPIRPTLYTEHSAAITDQDGFEDLLTAVTNPAEAETQYWLVGGLAFIPSTESTSDNDIQNLYCQECGEIRPHTFDGPAGIPSELRDFQHNGQGFPNARMQPEAPAPLHEIGPHIWQCLQCRTARTGPAPADVLDDIEAAASEPDTSPTEHPPQSHDPATSSPELTDEMLPKQARGPDGLHEHVMEYLQEQDELPDTRGPRDDTLPTNE